MPRPGAGVLRMENGRPSSQRAWRTSPAETSLRMRLEETLHAADLKRRVDVDGKSEPGTEGAEFVDAGLSAVSEAEVVAFVDLDRVEAMEEHVAGEGFSALPREFGGKGKDDDGIDAGGGKEIEAFGQRRRDEAWTGAGAQQIRGVGLKGDRDRPRAERVGTLDDACQQEAMAKVHPVIVADTDDGGSVVVGQLGGIAEDLHGFLDSIGTRSPSYARRTDSGNCGSVSACMTSCDMWVNQVLRAPIFSAQPSASAMLACVGCGCGRSASRQRCRRRGAGRSSTPECFHVSKVGGIAEAIARTCRRPCMRGTR